MKNAMYFAIFLYFLRKVFHRVLPVDTGATWEVLWLLLDDDTPTHRDRYIRIYNGPSPIIAWWVRERMLRHGWSADYVFVYRKGQERNIRILDLDEDFSEIYDLMDEDCADELREIAREARAK